jgi:hypothetical protein
MNNNTLVAVLYGEFSNWQGGFDKRDFINIYAKDIKKELSKQSIFEYCSSFNALDIRVLYSPIVQELEDLKNESELNSLENQSNEC